MGLQERITALEIAQAELAVRLEHSKTLHNDIDALRETVHTLNARLWYIVGLSGSCGAVAGSGLAQMLQGVL